MLLDGDELRKGLCADLGFTPADRAENIRRAGEVARLLFGRGSIVICAFVSPYPANVTASAACFQGIASSSVRVGRAETRRRRDPKGIRERGSRTLPHFMCLGTLGDFVQIGMVLQDSGEYALTQCRLLREVS